MYHPMLRCSVTQQEIYFRNKCYFIKNGFDHRIRHRENRLYFDSVLIFGEIWISVCLTQQFRNDKDYVSCNIGCVFCAKMCALVSANSSFVRMSNMEKCCYLNKQMQYGGVTPDAYLSFSFFKIQSAFIDSP